MTRSRQVIAGTLALLLFCAGLLLIHGAFQGDSRDSHLLVPATNGGGTSASSLGAQIFADARPALLPYTTVPAEIESQAVGYPSEVTPESSKERAARMLLSNLPKEALALSQYVLQTRLGDDYWVEAIPTLVHSAHRLGELESVVPLMLTETVRPSLEYPDETHRFQSSILVGFIEALIDVGRADLANHLLEAVKASDVGDSLDEVISSYRVRIARILSGDQQAPA